MKSKREQDNIDGKEKSVNDLLEKIITAFMALVIVAIFIKVVFL